MNAPRILSLFSGAGGGDIGFERAGFVTAAYCEIDPYAVSVLKYHRHMRDWQAYSDCEAMPHPPILGDVRAISGGRKMKQWLKRNLGVCMDCGLPMQGNDYPNCRPEPLSLVHSSSPCQDLSVAGKRAGMKGLRSSLFFRSVRIWKILDCPHFLWENVPGALSSHSGEDFAQVLSALVGGPVAVPRVGKRAKWSSAGVVAGPDGVAAWRILDLQHLGPPQRRRRLFVFCARAGGVDPVEVLLEREGLRGDFEARRGPRQGAPARARGRAQAPRDDGTIDAFGDADSYGFNWQNGGGYGSANDGLAITPNAVGPLDKSTIKAVVTATLSGSGAGTARPGNARSESELIVYDTTQMTHPENRSNPQPGDPCHPLAAGAHPPMVFKPSHFTRGKDGAPSDITPPLSHDADKGNQDLIVLAIDAQNALASGKVFPNIDTGAAHTNRGPQVLEPAPTLTGHQRQQVDGAMVPVMGVPRRLMPIECERLMGWPDGWTKYGITTKGKVVELSDAARYRICGNGIGAPMTHWIGLRLMDQLTREE